MTTLDDVIDHFKLTIMLANNKTISEEEVINRLEQGIHSLEKIQSQLDLIVRTSYQSLNKLAKTNLTTEFPPEIKEIQK